MTKVIIVQDENDDWIYEYGNFKLSQRDPHRRAAKARKHAAKVAAAKENAKMLIDNICKEVVNK